MVGPPWREGFSRGFGDAAVLRAMVGDMNSADLGLRATTVSDALPSPTVSLPQRDQHGLR